MKKFCIPIVDKDIYIYVGKEEYVKFIKAIKSEGAVFKDGEEIEDDPSGGRCYGSWIWYEDLGDINTIAHELSHFLDNLFATIGSNDTEFRAYVTGYVMEKVLLWSFEQNKKEK